MFYCQPSARPRGPGARPHRDDRREPGLSWGEPRRRPAGGEPRSRPAGGEPQRRPAGAEAEPSRNTQVHATTGPHILRISFTFEESVVVTSSNLINFSIDRNNDTTNAIANGQQEHEHQHQHGANTGTSTSNQDDGDIDSESSTNTNSGAESSSDIMETADLANRFAKLRINISPGESSDRPESRSHQLASYTDIAWPTYTFI